MVTYASKLFESDERAVAKANTRASKNEVVVGQSAESDEA